MKEWMPLIIALLSALIFCGVIYIVVSRIAKPNSQPELGKAIFEGVNNRSPEPGDRLTFEYTNSKKWKVVGNE